MRFPTGAFHRGDVLGFVESVRGIAFYSAGLVTEDGHLAWDGQFEASLIPCRMEESRTVFFR